MYKRWLYSHTSFAQHQTSYDAETGCWYMEWKGRITGKTHKHGDIHTIYTTLFLFVRLD